MNLVNQRHQAIAGLQRVIESMPESKDFREELFHHFSRGLYAREMRIPAGSLIVGKQHKYPCLNFIMTGTAEVRSHEGAKRYDAPHIFSSGAGTKRAMYAVTDITWVTVHPTNETDLERLEESLIDDHSAFLSEYGLDEAIAQQVSDFPWIKVQENYVLSDSPIHGIGVFSLMNKGDRLTASLEGQKTEVGRFTNHSPFPNVVVVKEGNSVFFEATESIDGEVKVNYRHVINAVLEVK
jgi:hypothetical protein